MCNETPVKTSKISLFAKIPQAVNFYHLLMVDKVLIAPTKPPIIKP